jgi:hypothetical protein
MDRGTKSRAETISRAVEHEKSCATGMENQADDQSLLDDPKRSLLDMAQEYSGVELLRLIVMRLSRLPRVAIARVWLAQPTADCSYCPMPKVCCVQSRCLHLACGSCSMSSSGRSSSRREAG